MAATLENPIDEIEKFRPEPTILAVAKRGHVPELDALRAFAIIAVLLAHMLFTYPSTPAATAFLPAPLAVILEHGWLGVDLFFVLSGFLITGILLETKSRGQGAYFKRFYVRRAARILPLYFAVLIALFIALRLQDGPYFALCALMSANLASIFHVAVPDAAGPYWSLAVEEQFYLIWPWLVLWLGRRHLALAAAAVIVIEPFVRLGASSGALELTWFRADGLGMGAFLAVWFSGWDGNLRKARTLALSLVGIAAAVTVAGIPFGILGPGELSTSLRITQAVLLFGAALTLAVAYSGRPALGFLRSSFLATTAILSYCLYLVHKPITDALAWALSDNAFYLGLPPEASLLLRAVLVLGIAFSIAVFSRMFLEMPFIEFGQRKS